MMGSLGQLPLKLSQEIAAWACSIPISQPMVIRVSGHISLGKTASFTSFLEMHNAYGCIKGSEKPHRKKPVYL